MNAAAGELEGRAQQCQGGTAKEERTPCDPRRAAEADREGQASRKSELGATRSYRVAVGSDAQVSRCLCSSEGTRSDCDVVTVGVVTRHAGVVTPA